MQHLAQVSLCKKNNTGIRGVLNVKKSENNLKIPFFLSSDQRSDNVAPEFPKFSDLFRAYIGNYFLLLSNLKPDSSFADSIRQLWLIKVGNF